MFWCPPPCAATPAPPACRPRDTLLALFADLERQFPGVRFRVVDEQGLLRANMRVFVNGQGTRDLNHALRPDDDVAIVLALSGG